MGAVAVPLAITAAMTAASVGAQVMMQRNAPKMGSPGGLPAGGPKPGPKDLSQGKLMSMRKDNYQTPSFLSLNGSMTPTQQRNAIASGGVGSDDPRYRDPETLQTYQQMLLNNYPTSLEQLSDVEKQYITQIGGSPKTQTPEGYLSALNRAIG